MKQLRGERTQREHFTCDLFITFSTSHPPTQQHKTHHQVKEEEKELIISVYNIQIYDTLLIQNPLCNHIFLFFLIIIKHGIPFHKSYYICIHTQKQVRPIINKQGGRQSDCDIILFSHSIIVIDNNTHTQAMSYMNIKFINILYIYIYFISIIQSSSLALTYFICNNVSIII